MRVCPTNLSASKEPSSPIVPNSFDRTGGQGFLTGNPLGFVFGLLANVGVCVLERPGEVLRRRVTADVAIDARRIDIERPINVFFDYVFGIRHGRIRMRSEPGAVATGLLSSNLDHHVD